MIDKLNLITKVSTHKAHFHSHGGRGEVWRRAKSAYAILEQPLISQHYICHVCKMYPLLYYSLLDYLWLIAIT